MNIDKLIFVDLETTGFDPEVNQIMQISAVDCFTGEIFNEYVRFRTNHMNSRALEINHYNEDLWEEKAITQKKAFYAFQEWLSKRLYYTRTNKKGEEYNTAMIAGHNLSCFDINFLKEWECMFCDSLHIDYACFDTLQLARWLLPELDSHSLERLCYYYEIDVEDLHNSLTDVLCNVKIAYKILSDMVTAPKWHRSLYERIK